MAKKWSQKTEKTSLVANDEFLIIDSEDATPATKNKRVKVKNAAPYKKYVALLTQTGTDAPVATVVENTIGAIVWTRFAQGDLRATLAGAFTLNKTWIGIVNGDNGNPVSGFASDENIVKVKTPVADGILVQSSVEIRVYPITLP